VLCPKRDFHVSALHLICTESKMISCKTPTAWNEDGSVISHIHANRALKSGVFVQCALFFDTVHDIGRQLFGKLFHIFGSDIYGAGGLAKVFDQMWMTTIDDYSQYCLFYIVIERACNMV